MTGSKKISQQVAEGAPAWCRQLQMLNLVATTWHWQVNLGKWSYFQVGVEVPAVAMVKSEIDLLTLVNFLRAQKIPYYIFGGLSNTLFARENFEGVIILYRGDDLYVWGRDQATGRALITAASGVLMSQVAKLSIKEDLFGLAEFASLPGTVGGAIYNNAHASDKLVGTYLLGVRVFYPAKNQIRYLGRDELNLDYDQSIFQTTNAIILEAIWQLEPAYAENMDVLAKNAFEKRQKTQPLNLPSLGCFWQNPQNNSALQKKYPQFAALARVPAGFLIDQVGLKGAKCAGIEVSDKHAAFLVKTGESSVDDVLKLAAQVKEKVKKIHGVDLEPEVKIVK